MYNLISSKSKFPSNFNIAPRRAASAMPLFPPAPLPSAIYENVFEAIGNTPLVKLNHPDKLFNDLGIEKKEIKCNICMKLEYLNPGGSIKDRIGKSLMDLAKTPVLKLTKGDKYFLEASSGNTGIAVSMNVAKAVAENLFAGCYIVTTEKCSNEKVNVMKLVGAKVCMIKNDVSEEQIVDEAINKKPHQTIVLEQFVNQVNPQTHYTQTAEEIYKDLDRKWPDMIVMAAGSGGTFTGIATRIKNETSECTVVAVDPENSTVFHYNPFPAPFLVEGLVGSSVPINIDKSLFDECQVVSDKEAFHTARNLAKYEGILCGYFETIGQIMGKVVRFHGPDHLLYMWGHLTHGHLIIPLLQAIGGSSGLAVAAAIKAIVNNNTINTPGKIVVVILPDGIRNYMSKFVLDQWMEAHLFKEIPPMDPNWYNYPIVDHDDNLFMKVLQRGTVLFLNKDTCGNIALKSLIKLGGNAAAMITDQNHIFNDIYSTVGLATLNSIRYHLTNPRLLPYEDIEDEGTSLSKSVTNFMEKELYVVKLPLNDKDNKPTVGLVARILDLDQYVVLGYERKDPKTHAVIFYGKYVATAKDVLTFRQSV